MKQNILKRWLVVLLVALVGGPAALAQQSKIAVASFTRMETDITARVTAPKKDQNGEICALICERPHVRARRPGHHRP